MGLPRRTRSCRELKELLSGSEMYLADGIILKRKRVNASRLSKKEEIEKLGRSVRSILNKLTPQKFKTLVDQMTALRINSVKKLTLSIDLIFEKVISEPGYSVAYANMCRVLTEAFKTVPGARVGKNQSNIFRKILLNKVQEEFEDKPDEKLIEEERNKTFDSEQEKKAWLEELDYRELKNRRRTMGNIRFMGELFKSEMISEKIMHECILRLLRNTKQEYLEEQMEGLCKLLSTIGKDLDHEDAKPRINQYFQQIQKIMEKKKLSSRIRFALRDVIDLREGGWVPRRDEFSPKTINQIHREAHQEEKVAEIQRQQDKLKRSDPRNRDGVRDSPVIRSGGNNNVDGWMNIPKTTRSFAPTPVDAIKFKTKVKTNKRGATNALSRELIDIGNNFNTIQQQIHQNHPTAIPQQHQNLYTNQQQNQLHRQAQHTPQHTPHVEAPPQGAAKKRATIILIDPNTGKDITNEVLKKKEKPAPAATQKSSIPVMTSPVDNDAKLQTNAQFASQIAALSKKLEYTLSNSSSHDTQSHASKIQEELLTILKSKTENKMVMNFIDENVKEVSSSKFIRELTFTVCKSVIHEDDQKKCSCDKEALKYRRNVLLRYIDNKKELELQAAYALQQLVTDYNHPRGLLTAFFKELYDGDVITEDTFYNWESSKEFPDGKGNAKSDVKGFITWLREAAEESNEDEPTAQEFSTFTDVMTGGQSKSVRKRSQGITVGRRVVDDKSAVVRIVKDFVSTGGINQLPVRSRDSSRNNPFSSGAQSTVSQSLPQNPSVDVDKTRKVTKSTVEEFFGCGDYDIKRNTRGATNALSRELIVKGEHECLLCDKETLDIRQQILFDMIDGKKCLELEVLYALQEVISEMNHPRGLLTSLFEEFYSRNIITKDTFMTWEMSEEVTIGKPIALIEVKEFLTRLKS